MTIKDGRGLVTTEKGQYGRKRNSKDIKGLVMT